MSNAWGSVVPAFTLGFALGAAPGPVQVLILSETARRGLNGGLRVMLGANLTLLAILLLLAVGFSSFVPATGAVRALHLAGGAFLVWLGIRELLTLRRETAPTDHEIEVSSPGRLGPTTKGLVSVLLNPGAWVFFATTASAVILTAATAGGTAGAVLTAVSMAVGVSCSDLTFSLLGSGGRRLLGDRALLGVRAVLAGLLAVIGLVFVARGVTG